MVVNHKKTTIGNNEERDIEDHALINITVTVMRFIPTLNKFQQFKFLFVDQGVNYGQNKIIISIVRHSPAKPKFKIWFEKKQRTSIHISENKSILFEKIAPVVQYYL